MQEYPVRYRDDLWEKLKELLMDFDSNLFAYMLIRYFYKQLNATYHERNNFENLPKER